MVSRDGRKFPVTALEELRRLAIEAVESGIPQVEVARVFGVSRQTVGNWVRTYRSGGEEALRPRKRGRRPGDQLALSAEQQTWVIDTLVNCSPEQVGLRHWLWTRQAVAELVSREFRITLGTASIRNYLIRWGLVTEGHLLQSLRVRHGAAVDGLRLAGGAAEPGPAWIQGAEILWAGWLRTGWSASAEVGRPGVATGRTFLRPDTMPEVNVLFAVSNRGAMFFVVRPDPFDGVQLRDFLVRLTGQVGKQINVVVGWRPNYHREELWAWLESNAEQTAVRFSPT